MNALTGRPRLKGLNLHHVVRGGISAVLPDAEAVLLLPAPWAVDDAYRPQPEWLAPQRIEVHSQPVPDKLAFAGQERDSTIRRDFYLYGLGCVLGVSRADQLGGALLYWDGGEWLVEVVLEDWSQAGWCKCRTVLQRRTPEPALPELAPDKGEVLP